MDKMIFTVMNGMKIVEQRQANTFNELANLSTVGFKKSFSYAASSRDLVGGDMLASRAFPTVVGQNIVDLKAGPFVPTNNPMDLYVTEKGLFSVLDESGQEAYTRRGDMKITSNGVLTTGAGHLLLGDDGPITIPPSKKVEISADGAINIIPANDTTNELVQIARLKLVNGEDQTIQIRSDGLYQTADRQILEADANIKIQVGGTEGSSANAIDSMVQMIRDSREYEMHVRILKNAKELSTSSTSMMRLDG